MSEEHLLVEKADHVLVLRMHRPEAKNAFSPNMLARMAEAWQRADADEDVRCVILTGSDDVFCAGADLKAMGRDPAPGDEYAKRFKEDAGLAWVALLRHYRLTKPLIAAVEGPAIAGGTEILQATDIRVAGESATFGVAEVRRGLFPLGGSTVRLRRQIPYTLAAEMLLTGKTISAAEALAYGLIGHVVPDGTALAKAREIAALVCANGPVAVRSVKRSLQETEGLPEEEALKVELEIGMHVFATEDAKEGPRAFAEKRAPNFVGR
ncbi:MAG: crotonase/enoyl-CoA hydratase family protein [Actinomycetota bacterium]|nr:crotonase/enoyl-CoA hydratase family protein [Actinomycetota bacterium]